MINDIVVAWQKVLVAHEGRKEPQKMSEAQELLEAWWNEDPEMRHAQILCGRELRVCVRLYQLWVPKDEGDEGCGMMGEGEAATLEEAIRVAVEDAKGGRDD